MSQAPATAANAFPARTIDLIVVHCSATPSGQALATGLGNRRRTAAQIIDHWHMQRGFARAAAAVASYNPGLPHIGYHYVIDLDGLIQGGRRLAEVGAHVAGHNAHSVGICLVGGAELKARYSRAQWGSLKQLVGTLSIQRPGIRVLGHRDLSPDANGDGTVTPGEWLKTCPGFDVGLWWSLHGAPPADQVL
jgi:N-acetyl-anhydromuramyl-L-alanine amidase AmpD